MCYPHSPLPTSTHACLHSAFVASLLQVRSALLLTHTYTHTCTQTHSHLRPHTHAHTQLVNTRRTCPARELASYFNGHTYCRCAQLSSSSAHYVSEHGANRRHAGHHPHAHPCQHHARGGHGGEARGGEGGAAGALRRARRVCAAGHHAQRAARREFTECAYCAHGGRRAYHCAWLWRTTPHTKDLPHQPSCTACCETQVCCMHVLSAWLWVRVALCAAAARIPGCGAAKVKARMCGVMARHMCLFGGAGFALSSVPVLSTGLESAWTSACSSRFQVASSVCGWVLQVQASLNEPNQI